MGRLRLPTPEKSLKTSTSLSMGQLSPLNLLPGVGALPYLLAYNKPCGTVCSLSDECGRSDLHDVIPIHFYRAGLHPIGRLDQHSCGLLLFTTDGRLTKLLLDPSSALPRRYECVVSGAVDGESLSWRLQSGVENRFGESYFAKLLYCRPATSEEPYEHKSCADGNRRYDGPVDEATADWADRVSASEFSVVTVEVWEGKQRMVRRMLAHCGHHVLNLRRLAYGNISLGSIVSGQFRECTDEEISGVLRLLRIRQEGQWHIEEGEEQTG
jgi:pseudouridine synthase